MCSTSPRLHSPNFAAQLDRMNRALTKDDGKAAADINAAFH
jgi:hypothetical protein